MAMNDPGAGDPGAAGAGGPPTPEPLTFPLAYVQELRRENAKHRTRAQELEASKNAELRAVKLDLALTRAAHAHGVDVDFATFLLTKNGWLAAQDPNGESFAETLKDRLDSLVAEHPQMKTGAPSQVPRTSGVTPGPGATSTQLTAAQVAEIAKRHGPEAVVDLLNRGDLNQLLRRSG